MKPTVGDIVRTSAFSLVFYTGTVGYVLASVGALPFGRARFRRVVEGWSIFHRFCVERLLGIRVVVKGHIPDGSVLFAMRHESFLEAIETPLVIRHPGVFAKVELLRIPLWGKAAAAYGVVPVEREQGAKALRRMVTAARELVAEGRPLAIFPEGTRVPHGERRALGAGFAGLYKLLGLPVVPIAVDSGPLYHRRWKRRGTITYRVGEPIPPGLPREEIEQRVFEEINALNSPEPMSEERL